MFSFERVAIKHICPDVNKSHFRTSSPDFFSSQVLLSLLSCLLQSLEILLFCVLTHITANSWKPYPLKEWNCNPIPPFKSFILEEKTTHLNFTFEGILPTPLQFFFSSIERKVF